MHKERSTVPIPAAFVARRPSGLRFLAAILLTAVLWACGTPGIPPTSSSQPSGGTAATGSSGTITLYASVQQPVVDAVIAAFAEVQPGVRVDLFRAPTGELSARIAAELREGRVQGDVLWLTDPLSIQGWADRGILQAWSPEHAAALDPADRTDTFFGTRVLNVVIVRAAGRDAGPSDWDDLTDPDVAGMVGLPDPGFAGSAMGALGYFGLSEDYGFPFYERLAANGAVQVKSPDEVTTGVAEGRFLAGMTLDSSARAAVDKGSPVELVWPGSGAVAMYSPIAVVDGGHATDAARAFVDFVLSPDGQRVLGEAGQVPILPDSGGPEPGGPQVRPDWPSVFGRQDELLARYRSIFGG